MYLHAIILKTGGMDSQASDLFRVMYSLHHRKVTSEWFYEDLSTALKEVGMENEAYQVINDNRRGTTQRMFAEFEEDDDEFDDAHDHM